MTAPSPKFSYPSKTAYYNAWATMERDGASGTAAGQLDIHSAAGLRWVDENGRQWLIALNFAGGTAKHPGGTRAGNLVATDVDPDGGTGEVRVLAIDVDEELLNARLHERYDTYEEAAAFGSGASKTPV